MSRKPNQRVVGLGKLPAAAPAEKPKPAQPQPPASATRRTPETPDDLGGAVYSDTMEYLPLMTFLLGLPEGKRARLQDLRAEGMRAAEETLKRGLPVKKLPHAKYNAVLCYPRVVLEEIYRTL